MPTIRQPRSQDLTAVRTISPLFGLIAFAAWIAAEIMAFNLVAGPAAASRFSCSS
jgi:hypothetical protein